MDTRILLGVDGGGTKTEAWLARADGVAPPVILGRGKAASSNPRAVGLSTALAHLSDAIIAAFAEAALPVQPVGCAVLAMSGAGHAAVRQQIANWAERRNLAQQLEQVHDADPVLVAGTPEGWGVALIVGTGSAAIGVDRAGRREIVGGWGYWFGDEGSAYWIGRRALDAVARSADGRCPPTPLTDAVLAKLNVAEPRAMLGALEATGNVRGVMASLATIVTTSAAAGDATATAILRDAASELADMIASLAARVDLGAAFPLALTGGVACNSDELRIELAAALTSRGLTPQPTTVVSHPVAGCVALARRAIGK
jgi:N-acetylglucosamine kinase-like BadF-type ATPase